MVTAEGGMPGAGFRAGGPPPPPATVTTWYSVCHVLDASPPAQTKITIRHTLRMAIVRADGTLVQKLVRAGISDGILDNCRNSKFLAVRYDGGEIMGVCFVSGFLNNSGTEVSARYRGRGLSRLLLKELLDECRRRKMPFLTGAFKPFNVPSIRAHTGAGYVPVFTFHYSRAEGQEMALFVPLSRGALLIRQLLRAFDTRVGNAAFALIIKGARPLLKILLGFSADVMPRVDLGYGLRNFEKVGDTIKKHASAS